MGRLLLALVLLAGTAGAQTFGSCAQHPNLCCLAGRAGTANDLTLTTGASTGTVYGSTNSSGFLTLKANSSTNNQPIFLDGSSVVVTNSGSGQVTLGIREPIAGGTSANFFQSPSLAADVTYTLPASGSVGYLHNDGSNVWTWDNLSSVFQPLDADLTSIAALSGTGIASRTAANTWTLTGGTATQMLYWDTGGLVPAAEPALTYDPSTNILTLIHTDGESRFVLTGPSENLYKFSTTVAPTIGINRARGTNASRLHVNNGDLLGTLAINGLDDQGPSNFFPGLLMTATATQDWVGGVNGTRAVFISPANGSDGISGTQERLAFESDSSHQFFGPLYVKNIKNSGIAGDLRLYEPAAAGSYGTNFTSFVAQAQASDITYTLPATAPARNGQGLSATTAGVMKWTDEVVNVCAAGAVCDATIGGNTAVESGTDDTTAVQAAIDSLTRGTVLIPSSKNVLLTSKITLKDGVILRCESGAGIILSARQCVGGTFVGAPCHANADCTALDAPWPCCTGVGTGNCGNAECPSSTCSGTAFAPVAATSYPVIDFTSSNPRRDGGVIGCSIRAMQVSPYWTCSGSGSRAGETCTTNDTNGTTGCPTNGACSSAGQPGYPSGPGKINPIDLTNSASQTLVRDNTVYDLRSSDQIFKVKAAQVNNNNIKQVYEGVCCDSNSNCSNVPPGSVAQTCGFNYIISTPTTAVSDGIVATGIAYITDNQLTGSAPVILRTAIDAQGTSSIVRGNVISAGGSGSTTTGIKVVSNSFVSHNTVTLAVGATTIIGVQGTAGGGQGGADITDNDIVISGNPATVTGISADALNMHVTGNAVTISGTPSVASIGITIGQQSEISGNNILSNLTSANAIGIGDNATGATGTAGQTRLIGNLVSAYTALKMPALMGNVVVQGNRFYQGDGTKVILGGAAGWKLLGNYLAWGNSAILLKMANDGTGELTQAPGHPEVDGNTFFVNGTNTAIQFPDVGKRCDGGTKINQLCVNDNTTDCPGATCPGCCDAQAYGAVRIANNEFIANTICVDLSALTTGVGTSFTSGSIIGNVMPCTTSIKLPTTSGNVAGLGIIGNNFVGATTPIANPNFSMFDIAGNSPPPVFTNAQINTGSASNGTLVYCSDCDDFAQAGGSGALVTRVNGKWVATTTDWALQNVREWSLQKTDDIAGTLALEVSGIDETVNTANGATAADLVDTTGTYVNYASAAVNPSDAGWISSRFTLTRTDQSPVFTAVIKTGTEAVSTTTRWFVGMASATPMGAKAPTVHAAGLTFDTSGSADTNWMCTTCNGTTCTSTSTGIAYATDTRYILKVACVAGQCDCYVNGALKVSNTTNLPTSTQAMGYNVQVRTLAASARGARISKIDMLHR